jgi:hypothetical protein
MLRPPHARRNSSYAHILVDRGSMVTHFVAASHRSSAQRATTSAGILDASHNVLGM